MNDNIKIKIEEQCTKIENNTNYALYVALRPTKIGERIKDEYRVFPNESLILYFEIDLKDYCLYWEEE